MNLGSDFRAYNFWKPQISVLMDPRLVVTSDHLGNLSACLSTLFSLLINDRFLVPNLGISPLLRPRIITIEETPGSWIWAQYEEVISNKAARTSWCCITISLSLKCPSKDCTPLWEMPPLGRWLSLLAPSESVLADFSLIETKVTFLLPLHFPSLPPFSPFICLSSQVIGYPFKSGAERMTKMSFLLSRGLTV